MATNANGVGLVLLAALAGSGGCSNANSQDGGVAPAPPGFTQLVPASDTIELEMVGVPGAESDDGTVHPAFWIAKTELTWDAYDVYRLCEDMPYRLRDAAIDAKTRPTRPYGAPDYGFGHEGWPAMSITKDAAEEFCAWLAEQTGRPWRLPTESEWERACRAGGDPLAAGIDAVAWTFDNGQDQTHAVATRAPNGIGLHDMLGNVGEWCRTDDGTGHVLRGGSFYEFADEVTPAFRAAWTPSWQARDPQIPQSTWWLSDGPFAGFRPMCEIAPQEPK